MMAAKEKCLRKWQCGYAARFNLSPKHYKKFIEKVNLGVNSELISESTQSPDDDSQFTVKTSRSSHWQKSWHSLLKIFIFVGFILCNLKEFSFSPWTVSFSFWVSYFVWLGYWKENWSGDQRRKVLEITMKSKNVRAFLSVGLWKNAPFLSGWPLKFHCAVAAEK